MRRRSRKSHVLLHRLCVMDGRQLFTLRNLIGYAERFENRRKNAPVLVIDVTDMVDAFVIDATRIVDNEVAERGFVMRACVTHCVISFRTVI